MKKLLSIFLVVCLVFVAACGTTEPGPAPATPTPAPSPPAATDAPAPGVNPDVVPEHVDRIADHITIMNDGVVTPVIDAFSNAGTAAQSNWVYTMITDKLIVLNEDTGEFEPMLALSWTTPDFRTFTFNLREDVYFHNGEHFTAADVKFTAEISREFPGSHGYDRWRPVVEANVISTYVVELVLENPNAGFYTLIASPPAGIYNEVAYQTQPDTWTWIGTGPYYVSGFSSNDYVDLTRNDNFWGEISPTQTVSFRYVPEEAVRPVMLMNGEFQFSLGILPDDLHLFDGNADFQQLPRFLSSPISVGFNQTDPITSDRNFRMAVIYALDGNEIGLVGEGDRGYAPMDDGSVWGKSVPFRNTNIPRIQQNIETAKEYLEASVWNGEVVRIAAMPGGLGRCAEMLQEQMKAIGLELDVQIMDQPSLFAHVAFGNNQSQMYIFPAIFDLCPFMGTRNNFTNTSSNMTSYVNPLIEELIVRAEGTIDPEGQRAIFYEIQEIVAEDYPLYPMFWKQFVDVSWSNVGGFKMSNTSPWHIFRGIYQILD